MCNAHNHPSGCNCGWGGNGRGRGRSFDYKFENLITQRCKFIGEAKTYKTRCWYCGAAVFYHTNGYGDCVLFDQLGYPWEIHSCWVDYCRRRKVSQYSYNLNSSIFNNNQYLTHTKISSFSSEESKIILLKGVISYLNDMYIPATPGLVAQHLGIFFITEFEEQYKDLFYKTKDGIIKLIIPNPILKS